MKTMWVSVFAVALAVGNIGCSRELSQEELKKSEEQMKQESEQMSLDLPAKVD